MALQPILEEKPLGVVFRTEDGWYYWDETWSNYCGPFRTDKIAEASLLIYCEYELEGTPLPKWND